MADQDDDDGLTVALSPVQMAGIMHGEDVSFEATVGNRLWGAVTLLGGALEMTGGSALILTPEPTMITKVGGWALAIHGSDTASTGLRQIYTGRPENTLTEQAAEGLAHEFGASRATAHTIGVTVDILVPLVVLAGIGAARVAAVRAGRISLAAEEAAGGHTIARHIGQTEAALRARLLAQRGIPAASTFFTQGAAERVISDAIAADAQGIRQWARATAAAAQNGGRVANYVIVHDAREVIGQGVVRATNSLQTMTRLRIVLRWSQVQGRLYFILTSFPVP